MAEESVYALRSDGRPSSLDVLCGLELGRKPVRCFWWGLAAIVCFPVLLDLWRQSKTDKITISVFWMCNVRIWVGILLFLRRPNSNWYEPDIKLPEWVALGYYARESIVWYLEYSLLWCLHSSFIFSCVLNKFESIKARCLNGEKTVSSAVNILNTANYKNISS